MLTHINYSSAPLYHGMSDIGPEISLFTAFVSGKKQVEMPLLTTFSMPFLTVSCLFPYEVTLLSGGFLPKIGPGKNGTYDDITAKGRRMVRPGGPDWSTGTATLRRSSRQTGLYSASKCTQGRAGAYYLSRGHRRSLWDGLRTRLQP